MMKDRDITSIVRVAKASGGGSGANFRMVKFRSVQEDHLVCRSWDGTIEGAENILVAKPPHLQRSAYHGKTRAGVEYTAQGSQTRLAQNTSTNKIITEAIVPSYVFGDIIYVDGPVNTGIKVGEKKITLKDGNDWGRSWAQQKQ